MAAILHNLYIDFAYNFPKHINVAYLNLFFCYDAPGQNNKNLSGSNFSF